MAQGKRRAAHRKPQYGSDLIVDLMEAFDIEYWALEEAKLQRMPPEAEFERQVVVVIGAGSGIGRARSAVAGQPSAVRTQRRGRRRTTSD